MAYTNSSRATAIKLYKARNISSVGQAEEVFRSHAYIAWDVDGRDHLRFPHMGNDHISQSNQPFMSFGLSLRNQSLSNNPPPSRNRKRSRGGESLANTPGSDFLQKDFFANPKEPNFFSEHGGDGVERDLPSGKSQQSTIVSIDISTSNPIAARNNLAMATILSDLYFFAKKLREVKQIPQEMIAELDKLIGYYQNF